MKAIYFVIAILPLYLLLVLGDFYYQPLNLLIPASFVLVLIAQVAGPLALKRILPIKALNLLGGACLALVCIHLWVVTGAQELSLTSGIIIKIIIALAAVGGLAYLFLKPEREFVHPVAATGLGLGLADVLILVLISILSEDLPVFFYISMVPMILVLFFNSLVTFLKRPEPA